MKKLPILLCALFLCAGCTPQDANISANAPEVKQSVAATTNTNQTQPGKEKSKPLPEYKKTAFLSFDSLCPNFRCPDAMQHDVLGDVGTTITPPAGYQFLHVDVLPKDYVLLIKNGNVFTYKPSTQKITPSTFNDTKEQLKLKDNETLFAKEAYDVPGKYVFILAGFVTFDGDADMPFTKITELKQLITYDRAKDVLLHKNIKSFADSFVMNEESGDVLSNSPFLYDATHGRLLAWGGLNHDAYSGPIGEPTPNMRPLLITSFKDGAVKKYEDADYIAPTSNGKVVMIPNNSFQGNSLKDITLLENSDVIKKTRLTWSTQAKKEVGNIKDLREFEYGFDRAEVTNSALTLYGFWGKKLVLSVKKGVITGATL